MISYNRSDISDETLVSLYKSLLTPRLVEEKMLILLRQGKITKWFSGIGQEAVSVGVTMALEQDEYILPLHRNLGVFTSRNIPLQKLFAQFQGKTSGFTKGRDRSFHFGSRQHHIVGMISHLGAMLPVADGIALANKLSGKNKVCVAFSGDGASSEGDFHEALNVAAVWQLPVIFIVENNGYSISTPVSEQFAIRSFTEKAAGYGINALQIDGNNILDVFTTIREQAAIVRITSKPVLIEAVTFRMRGHEEASPTKYVPDELFEQWAQKDPITNFERYLTSEKILNPTLIRIFTESIKQDIEVAWNRMEEEQDIVPSISNELEDVYAPAFPSRYSASTNKSTARTVDAIRDAMALAMDKHANLVLMGQDIAEYGGVFKATEGLADTYGKDRVRNTPLCESAILGAALGMSIAGYKTMVEMQFADFVSCGFNQIVNNLAKSHYRWGQPADVVIRMPTGAGTGAGPFHSQSTEAWFFHVPGLKIVYPSGPYEAKGLLLAAFEDPNPVLFFEHKTLYRTISEEIPQGYYTIEIGKAKILTNGTSLTLITYGACTLWAKECLEQHKWEHEVELIDLRTLLPLDFDTLAASVKKTGRALLLTEDTGTGSIMAEIAARIGSELFEHLDAPVMRLSGHDMPVPFNTQLEELFLPKNRLAKKIEEILGY